MRFRIHRGLAAPKNFPQMLLICAVKTTENGFISPSFMNRNHIHFSLCSMIYCKFKGTVSRDFLLPAFFMNQFPPSPRVLH
jgi:hypothetical protein